MVSDTGSTSVRRDGVRRAFSTLGVVVVAAGAIFGADLFGVRERVLGSATPPSRPAAISPFVPVGSARGTETVLRSQPWWQRVRDLSGGATTTSAAFSIDARASQWRASWVCHTGRLLARLSAQSRPLINASCPASGTAYDTRSGRAQLQLSVGGPWELRVEQQVDVPLEEPPSPAITSPGTVAIRRGMFNRIDQTGTGQVILYRTASGDYLLRLTNFYVTPNVDLEIRLSPLLAPHSTRQFLSAPSVVVAPLDVTAGSLNFTVPRRVDPTRFRSVVIWCPLITSAYAAATLASAG
ncbi:MAG: DM13 domain-containing protein [Solirubrobacteraceae bacterium]